MGMIEVFLSCPTSANVVGQADGGHFRMTFRRELEEFYRHQRHEGCTASEVHELCQKYPVGLPPEYCDFLIVAGRHAGAFLLGTDYTYGQLDDLQEYARSLLEQNAVAGLPDQSFVVAVHQGYQFYFLNNGRVMFYMEGAEDFVEKASSFAEFFRFVVRSK